jgi:hypothetical protein
MSWWIERDDCTLYSWGPEDEEEEAPGSRDPRTATSGSYGNEAAPPVTVWASWTMPTMRTMRAGDRSREGEPPPGRRPGGGAPS